MTTRAPAARARSADPSVALEVEHEHLVCPADGLEARPSLSASLRQTMQTEIPGRAACSRAAIGLPDPVHDAGGGPGKHESLLAERGPTAGQQGGGQHA